MQGFLFIYKFNESIFNQLKIQLEFSSQFVYTISYGQGNLWVEILILSMMQDGSGAEIFFSSPAAILLQN